MVLICVSLVTSDVISITSFEKFPFVLCLNVLCPFQNEIIFFSVKLLESLIVCIVGGRCTMALVVLAFLGQSLVNTH